MRLRVTNYDFNMLIIEYIKYGREAQVDFLKSMDKDLYTFSKRINDCDIYYKTSENTLINYRVDRVMDGCKLEDVYECIANEKKQEIW